MTTSKESHTPNHDLILKENFRMLVQSVADYSIIMLDEKGTVLTWNEGAERIHGYTVEEILGYSFAIFYTEEAREQGHPQRELEIALECGRCEEEGWCVRKDGSTLWTNVIISPIYNEMGVLVGFSQVTRDLTERKLARRSEKILSLLVNGVKDYAIFMLDPNGRVMTWNEGAERINGYKAAEIIGRHFSEFYTKEARDSNHPNNELEIATLEGSYEEEGWRVRKDGTIFWAGVTITTIYDYSNELVGFAKVTRDLTESKLAAQKEEMFRLMVNGVSDYAIFMLSPEGNILTWNEGAERIKGYSADEVIGQHFSMFYTKEAQKRKHPQNELEIARAAGKYEEEGWRLRKDGNLFWASVVITAIYDHDKLIGFAKITRDLTQRLLSDQEREMAAKILDDTNNELRFALDVKNRFLSTMSHEVRTPISGIIGMTEILTLADLGEDNNKIVDDIFLSSKRLLQLLNNLLESARMESGDMSVAYTLFPIRSVVSDVRQLILCDANKKHLRITGSCDPRVPELVYGDELKIRQILLNLVHNAVKFTSNEGEVEVTVGITEEDSRTMKVRFQVRDTGIGIKKQDKEKLFQPFAQANDATKTLFGGAGLGLSISKQFVTLIGGNIGFDSEFGKGSKFWFEVPVGLGARNGEEI